VSLISFSVFSFLPARVLDGDGKADSSHVCVHARERGAEAEGKGKRDATSFSLYLHQLKRSPFNVLGIESKSTLALSFSKSFARRKMKNRIDKLLFCFFIIFNCARTSLSQNYLFDKV
jgi:hypothetical protein